MKTSQVLEMKTLFRVEVLWLAKGLQDLSQERPNPKTVMMSLTWQSSWGEFEACNLKYQYEKPIPVSHSKGTLPAEGLKACGNVWAGALGAGKPPPRTAGYVPWANLNGAPNPTCVYSINISSNFSVSMGFLSVRKVIFDTPFGD